MKLEDTKDSKFYLVDPSHKGFGLLSSAKMLFMGYGAKKMFLKHERPPFPIITDKPSVSDMISSINKGDIFLASCLYLTGVLWGFYHARRSPSIGGKLLVYHFSTHIFGFMGLWTLIACPYMRLLGYWDNGLKWRFSDDRIAVYDYTSDYEEQTIFKHFRIKP